MSGKRFRKQRMLKDLENEKRAFYEWIRLRQVVIVPDELALQSWKPNGEPAEQKQDALNRGSKHQVL